MHRPPFDELPPPELGPFTPATQEEQRAAAIGVDEHRRRVDAMRRLELLSRFERELVLAAFARGRDCVHELYASAVGPAATIADVAAVRAHVNGLGRTVELDLPVAGDVDRPFEFRGMGGRPSAAALRAAKVVELAADRAGLGLELDNKTPDTADRVARQFVTMRDLERRLAEELREHLGDRADGLDPDGVARATIAGVLGLPEARA